MNALVTGGSGFLGKALTRQLLACPDMRLRLLVRDPRRVPELDPERVELIQGDLRDPDSLRRAVQGVERVYHLATSTSGTWDDYLAETVHGTEHLVRAAAQAGVGRFVHVSSIWVADLFSERDVLDESAPYRTHGLNRYIRSKILAEQAVRRVSEEMGLDTVIARPGRIFGPGAGELLPAGFRLGKNIALVGWQDSAIPSVYVEHAAGAIRLIADSGEPGGIYHVVDDEPVQKLDYLRMLKRYHEPRLQIVRVPYPAIRAVHAVTGCVARLHRTLAELHRRTSMSMERLGGRSVQYSNARLRALGWRQERPTEANLLDTIRSFATPGDGGIPVYPTSAPMGLPGADTAVKGTPNAP